MNRGSFDCSFLLLCFCCFHFLKQRDFYTSYGIYRRYGCLSKCRHNLLMNNTYSSIFFPLFLETSREDSWIVLLIYFRVTRKSTFELRLINCDPRVTLQKWQTRWTNKHIKTPKKTEKEMKTNLPTSICLIDWFLFLVLFCFVSFFECMHGFT